MYIYLCQFTRNYTQTVKQTADNKRVTPWHTTFLAKCSVLYLLEFYVPTYGQSIPKSSSTSDNQLSCIAMSVIASKHFLDILPRISYTKYILLSFSSFLNCSELLHSLDTPFHTSHKIYILFYLL